LGPYRPRPARGAFTQPVKALRPGRVQTTSHNHGFAVAMPADGVTRFDTEFGPADVTHINLNDGVVEGLRLVNAPVSAVQFHPEAAPGPHDAAGLFGAFCEAMEGAR